MTKSYNHCMYYIILILPKYTGNGLILHTIYFCQQVRY